MTPKEVKQATSKLDDSSSEEEEEEDDDDYLNKLENEVEAEVAIFKSKSTPQAPKESPEISHEPNEEKEEGDPESQHEKEWR